MLTQTRGTNNDSGVGSELGRSTDDEDDDAIELLGLLKYLYLNTFHFSITSGKT